MGYEAIIINSNPETVSTDFDIADVLYFEPLTYECVMDILRRENPLGVIVQFGGQTAINLAFPSPIWNKYSGNLCGGYGSS